ncbi:hypothetical protein U7230_06085 [Carboxydochorda subterranea]|uniref:Segregation and condensation protein A n=1 Tax=Carboxydichorda subterranea TaxID=3109565 RepID=A0ABZ1C3A0_9FIRM|nr:hypothetical protein [Limnochorda sp. L945t]WRP18568.1 hypothetical protein U7230_06085 [Limnochorda sp. L945t]
MEETGAPAHLADLLEALQSGQQDPMALQLDDLVQQTIRELGPVPEDFQQQERWLNRAADALRVLSEMVLVKARLVAPSPVAPAEAAVTEAPTPALSPAEDEDEAGPDPSAELEAQAELYRRFREAAVLLEEQADAWSRHQPRPAPSELIRTIESWMQSWPEAMPHVGADALAGALVRVLGRQAMAERARGAPAPSLDWPRLFGRVRSMLGHDPVDMENLLTQAGDRGEVIGLFLAVLELVKVGEVWLQQQDGRIWIRKR